jgi:hypothetical protein
VYPVPTSGMLFVSGDEGSEYFVCDLAGMVIATGKLKSGTNGIDLTATGKGVYILTVDSPKGRTNIRVVKE